MIFNLEQTGTDVNFLVFDNNIASWDCLQLIHDAFPSMRENCRCIIVCWSEYENAVQLARD